MGAPVRFGVFEVDFISRELRKRGIRLHLPDQSFEILSMLVERPGEVITREQIRDRLWPHGTVVEFEHSVNAAVKRLRGRLGDSPTAPRFIETLPRRGYRFVAPVETGVSATSSPHFRILDELGQGGMGVVYRAEDLILGRTVVLKFLPEDLARHPPSVERFRREARTLASLNHPGICVLYGVEEHEGRLCLVMEYLEGQSLSRLMENGPLSLKEALNIAAQTSEAVAAAHSVGIVHRDITPANLFVTRAGQVKILDFGLAEVARQDAVKEDASPKAAVTEDSQTASAAVDGTAAYLSPEQIRGEAADVRSDIFSFGAVMYEMVTGRRAFKGDSNISTLAAVLHDEPEAVSRIVRGISSELGRIIEKTLKKDRGLRYQSASDLLTDLRRLQRDHESGRMASQPIELRAKMWRIALLAAVLAIALGALLVLLSAGGLRDRLRPRGTPPTGQIRLVVLPFDNLSGDPEQEYFSDGITEEMTAQLARLQPERLAVIGRSSAMTYKGGKKTIDQIGKELSVQYVLTGSVRRQGRRVRVTALLIKVSDQTHVWAEDFDRDLNDVLSVQTELAQEVSRQIRVTVPPEERSRETRARPVSPAAHEALLKGRFHLEKLTKEGGDKAGELFRQAIGIDPNYAPAYAALALHYTQLVHADLLPPREAFPQAKSCAEKALEIDPTLAEGWFASAQVRFLYEWDWSGAEKDLERGLELSPNDVFGHQTYANILSATGRPQEAIRQAKLARDIDPASLAANYFCGQHYFYARQYDQCMKLERQTLELDPRQPQGHLILGLALAEIGDLTPAVAEIQASHSYSHFDVYRGFLGYVYGLAGDTERARKELVDYRRRSSSGYTSAWLIAVIYAGLGEKEEALASLEKAYKDRDHNMALIKCWPMFDRLHSDPRFQSLLRRMNLPQ